MALRNIHGLILSLVIVMSTTAGHLKLCIQTDWVMSLHDLSSTTLLRAPHRGHHCLRRHRLHLLYMVVSILKGWLSSTTTRQQTLLALVVVASQKRTIGERHHPHSHHGLIAGKVEEDRPTSHVMHHLDQISNMILLPLDQSVVAG